MVSQISVQKTGKGFPVYWCMHNAYGNSISDTYDNSPIVIRPMLVLINTPESILDWYAIFDINGRQLGFFIF